jgi:hypothetical protein
MINMEEIACVAGRPAAWAAALTRGTTCSRSVRGPASAVMTPVGQFAADGQRPRAQRGYEQRNG